MSSRKLIEPKQTLFHFFVLLVISLLASPAFATIEWPQEITAPEGTIVIYQPQPETLAGTTLTGRAAISLEIKGKEDPVFGAMWFSSKLDVDGDVATVRDLKVTKVTWPDSKDAGEQRFTAIVDAGLFQFSGNRKAIVSLRIQRRVQIYPSA